MTHATHHGWIADERIWLHEIVEDLGHGWGGLLEMVSLVTLIAISAMGWLGVLAILIKGISSSL
jgi:hypothetical protein